MGVQAPELKKYMDKKLLVKLNGNRRVTGVLRGFDQFLNVVLDEVVDHGSGESIGMVVVRGASINLLEPQERLAM